MFKQLIAVTAVVCIATVQEGCVSTLTPYKLGSIQLALPEGYTQISETVDEIPSPIPGQRATLERFYSFEGPEGDRVYVFHWKGRPQRDYGPMSAQESWPVTLAGQRVDMARTDMFMGKAQEVVVVHAQISEDERLMVYSPNIPPAEFREILPGFEVR